MSCFAVKLQTPIQSVNFSLTINARPSACLSKLSSGPCNWYNDILFSLRFLHDFLAVSTILLNNSRPLVAITILSLNFG